jgi:hypothetical protein
MIVLMEWFGWLKQSQSELVRFVESLVDPAKVDGSELFVMNMLREENERIRKRNQTITRAGSAVV